ncbi:MAG: hypothetical protein A3F67_08145 [Verrucomicrobia bacterium RIFCSPHIGHO2_12_FULL_41_10]|nr:MAG: hypothetical protein A3F67_08145 [Verrucomicrobia bacterium RIFCSPHIGHO2_12_FULL_41_10]
MAIIQNDRDIALQATSPRVLAYNFGTDGNFLGKLNGTAVATVVSAALAPNGDITETILENSGTVITVNSSVLFQSLGIGSAGVFIGSGGLFGKDSAGATTFSIDASTGNAVFNGTLSAVQITSGTLDTGRIGATSITADKIATGTITATQIATSTITATQIAASTITVDKMNVSTLSAINANLGTVTAGNITGTANLDITGKGVFSGAYTSSGFTAAVHANEASAAGYGIYARAGSGGAGVYGFAGSASQTGVMAIGVFGGVALRITGPIEVTVPTTALNLNADMLDGYHSTSFCSIVPTDSGTCTVAGQGFSIFVTIAGYRSRGQSNIVYIEPTSDRKLKQDIVPEQYGLDFINSLIPVQYRLIANPKLKYHGFIAQDVEPLVEKNDSLFQTHDDGTVGTDYNSIIAPLVKAVQELTVELNNVKKELEDVKKNKC